jgi:antitoxin component YwqK of YwqJK toxin-antitoxin module
MNYEQGSLEGNSTYYHPLGNVWKQIPFEENVVNGTAEVYRATGELLQSTAYKQGRKEGSSFRYWQDGSIACEEHYVAGKLITGRYFTLSGEKVGGIMEGCGIRVAFGKEQIQEYQEFVDGKLEGKVTVLGPDGTIRRSYSVCHGVKHGEEVEYYPPSSLTQPIPSSKLSFFWYHGKIQGLSRTWYPDGSIESQREMANNKKHGLLSSWYRDGSIMMIEEYDHNHLVRGEYYARGEKHPMSQVIKGEGFVVRFDSDGAFLQKVPYRNGLPVAP